MGPKAIKKTKMENNLFQKVDFNLNYFHCNGLTVQNEKKHHFDKKEGIIEYDNNL